MAGIRTFGMAIAFVSGLAGVVTTAEHVQAETLTIGAAHSLNAPFQEIVPLFEREYGATIRVVYGPSQTLRREIEKGAPIDVFLPEAVEEVEKLEMKGLTLNGGSRVYAQTSLVLVMARDSSATSVSLRDVLPDRALRVALVDPKTSALGEITARALKKLNPIYRSRSHFLLARNSDDVLKLVHTGEADVGIVNRVDAINSRHVHIIDEAPAGSYTLVRFGQAVVWTCRNESRAIAEEFFDFIMSPRIQKLLHKYGFESIPSNASYAGSEAMHIKP